MQVVASGRYAGPKPGRSGTNYSGIWNGTKTKTITRPNLDICAQFRPNPPGSLDAGIRQTDRQTDGVTDILFYIIIIRYYFGVAYTWK